MRHDYQSRTRLRLAAATGIALALGPAAARPQTRPAERLAAAKSVSCQFTAMSVGTWSKAGASEAQTKRSTLTIGFESVDPDDGTAVVVGPFGPSDIIVRLSMGTLHFLQAYREGPLYATTIFPSETRDGKLKAAHTRHEYTEVSLPGYTSRPEQYYGECAITK
jgi:hypothetical protein